LISGLKPRGTRRLRKQYAAAVLSRSAGEHLYASLEWSVALGCNRASHLVPRLLVEILRFKDNINLTEVPNERLNGSVQQQQHHC
jgi:hypothetical protein